MKAPELPSSGRAFERIAAQYDAEATGLELSRWFRQIVWDRLARLFAPGEHVLELGCGTGEDAIWLAGHGIHVTATDASPAMLGVARKKAAAAGMTERITFAALDLAAAAMWTLPAVSFDGVFSNYGPLNCIPRWGELGRALAAAIRPGGRAAFAVMGPFCVWESAWCALHGDLRAASRRWRGRAEAHIGGETFPVYYPTPHRLQGELGPAWRRRALAGLGVFLPPGELYAAVGARPRLARALLSLERRLAAHWPFPWLGDHYWLELERA